MADSVSSWNQFLASNRLTPPLAGQAVAQHSLTLHRSLAGGSTFWVLNGPEGLELGGLHTEWQARRLGLGDVVFGLMPQSASTVVARDRSCDELLNTSYADGVYSLSVAMEQDLELFFQNAAGRVIHQASIPSRLRANWEHDIHNRAYWRYHAELGMPLVTVRIGDFEVTVHLQEGLKARIPVFNEELDCPPGTLWSVQQSALGDSFAQPLRRDCETEAPGNPGWVQLGNPEMDKLDEAVRVWCGTLPNGTHEIVMTVDGLAWDNAFVAPEMFSVGQPAQHASLVNIGGVFVTSEVFYVIAPFTKNVLIIARSDVGNVLAQHELWACPQVS